MMNNKGQSLVTFALLLPVLLLIVYMVYIIGRMSVIKNQLDSVNYLAIDYGLDIITEEDASERIQALIDKNISVDNVNITIEDDKLYIVLSKRYSDDGLVKKLIMLRSSYEGHMDNDKKIINENR